MWVHPSAKFQPPHLFFFFFLPPGNLLPCPNLLKYCSRIWVKLQQAGREDGEQGQRLIPSPAPAQKHNPEHGDTPKSFSPLQEPFGAAVPKAPLESPSGPEEAAKPLV